jgi:hypothetical protein
MLKGFKTVIFGLLVAAGPAALTYLGNVSWTSFGVSPTAGAVLGLIIVGLRAATNTPLGEAK